MKSRAHIDGHPIHPMLVPFPFAYLVGAACVDAAASFGRRPQWRRTARHMRVMGIGSALATAVPGIVDYFSVVPPKSSAARRATLHGVANLSAVGVMATVALRRRDDRPASRWELLAQGMAAGLMGVAGYLGGTLVYRNQIGVDHRQADAGKLREQSLPAPASPGAAIDAGAAADLQVNQMVLLHVGDRRVVVARTEEGVAAFDDRCTHRGGPLSDGTLACGVVQCPWHGSQFRVQTGAVEHGPAEAPIRTHQVHEAGGRLWLTLAD